MNENSLSACYITGSELSFILLQLIIVSFVELKGKTYIFNFLSVVESMPDRLYIYINRTY